MFEVTYGYDKGYMLVDPSVHSVTGFQATHSQTPESSYVEERHHHRHHQHHTETNYTDYEERTPSFQVYTCDAGSVQSLYAHSSSLGENGDHEDMYGHQSHHRTGPTFERYDSPEGHSNASCSGDAQLHGIAYGHQIYGDTEAASHSQRVNYDVVHQGG